MNTEPGDRESPRSGAAPAPRALTVLLVDDNPDDRLLVERQLREHIPGIVVLQAGSAPALADALARDFDAAITDYELRWSNGLEVLRQVKATRPSCPVIMFTASGSEEVAADAMKQGLDDYITKTPKHYARVPYALLAACERASQRAQLHELRERERINLARLQAALHAARTATWEKDLRTGRRAYSDDFGPLFGRPPGFVHENDDAWLADIHPLDRARVLDQVLAAVRDHADYHAEYRTLGPDGVERWLQSSGRVLRDEQGVPSLMVGATRDVTEWVATREALREQQQELQAIFDVMPVGVAISHDPRADHISLTPHFSRLLGLEEGADISLSGPGAHRLPFTMRRRGVAVAPDDLPMQRAARTGQRVEAEELDVVRDDGRTMTVLANAAPLFGADGSVRGVVCVLVDVSDLKRTQQELERADRQKNDFLATLAHELRNPLAPIRYSVALLQMQAHGSAVRKAADVIERQTAHMSRLLDDLLDLSRISRNKIELVLAPVDVRRVVELGCENARDLLDRNKHAFAIAMPAEPLWVCGDEVRLTQIVSNLLNNAAKFTPSGGRITIAAHRDGGAAVIDVCDTGIGIAADDLPHIFDMFTQASSKISGAAPGLGIGLAVVKSIVRMHGGEVTAESAGAGAGARFRVRLPLSKPPEGAAEAPASAEEGLLDACRALVVDDNRDAADALADLLQRAGCVVQVAYDGEEAKRAAAESPPGCVILDLGMPRANGFEVAQWIRAQAWGDEVFLVAVTGWGQDEDRAATRAAGFDAHLVKPVTPAEILRLLREHETAQRRRREAVARAPRDA